MGSNGEGAKARATLFSLKGEATSGGKKKLSEGKREKF